jgi:hypothetical protein
MIQTGFQKSASPMLRAISAAILLAAPAWLPMASARADDADYAIHLEHPMRVGDTWTLSAHKQKHVVAETTSAGKAPTNQVTDQVIDLTGQEEILQIDPKGRPTKTKLTVDTFTQTLAGNTRDIAAKGMVLILSFGDGKLIAREQDTPADPAIATALDTMVDVYDGHGTNNDLLGTDDRKKVGDAWPVNKDKIAEAARNQGVKVKAEDISGTTTLTDVKTVDDQPSIDLDSTVEIANYAPGAVPASAQIDSSHATQHYTGCYPVAENLPPSSASVENTIEFRLSSTRGGVDLHMHVTSTSKLTITRTAFQAGPDAAPAGADAAPPGADAAPAGAGQ